jgi:hypothetical protein
MEDLTNEHKKRSKNRIFVAENKLDLIDKLVFSGKDLEGADFRIRVNPIGGIFWGGGTLCEDSGNERL